MLTNYYTEQYRESLLHNVIPFWMKHSPDNTYGGYFTCLDREGNVFDTDKFIWLQCRQVWSFSMLYNMVEQKKEWLDMALLGAHFLQKYGRDREGNWYFALNREGKPLVQPYNIFSDCFAAMAFARLYQATGDKEHSNLAVYTFHNILERQENSKGIYNKSYPGTRPLKGFSMPMILSNLVLELEHLLPSTLVEQTISRAVHEVMDVFYQPELGLILENVSPEGHFVDSFEGRLVNPGHGLEAMWFIMDLGARAADQSLIHKAMNIALDILDYGWDKQFGGLLYFMDVKGYPPQQLEWDQKLWWVHIEALVAMAKGYMYTGDKRCSDWFEKLHYYTWTHFPDRENGEWYGYLNRRGEVLLPLKGGKWKGCFHVPRGLFQCWKTLKAIAGKEVVHG
ncbi:MAG TPA: AGE family epimerase/isomerase [Chitinophaga sp.]|uniref:AGE family epimerase/isomerase n=1 Tax=Chitinophaga sp. TaxID=1869181 RepID=UPI002CF4CBCF|nr:AGE family epimerase/isomerase [Chitinophaga sp.]HVI44808.1 AGE family epimerase/isomerase [Chitinophaga sp.]